MEFYWESAIILFLFLLAVAAVGVILLIYFIIRILSRIRVLEYEVEKLNHQLRKH